MHSSSPSPHLPNKPHLPHPHANAASPSPLRGEPTAGARLLRLCWLLLGCAFLAVFVFAIVTILVKGPRFHSSEATGPAAAQNESQAPDDSSRPSVDAAPELPLPDQKAPSSNKEAHAREVARVLGSGFAPAPAHDSLLPPPLPPPPEKSEAKELSPPLPPNPDENPPAQSIKTASTDADAAIERRLQISEDEARQQLLAVPELRLFNDLQIQNFREVQKKDEGRIRGLSSSQIDFAFNMQLNKYMREAALKEGLPLQQGPSCQLDPDTAMMVQTVSKNLRDLGFVSVPGSSTRVRLPSGGFANVGPTTIQNGTPKEKIEAFKEWCDVNKVEQFRGALVTLLQMLQVEDVPTRKLLVRELAKVNTPAGTAVLAKQAMVDSSPEVRDAALAALEYRPAAQYVPALLQGLRYPWPPVADRAAFALRRFKPEGAVPRLVALLDQPNPSLPVLDKRTKKPMVRELVRLNHMRSCLLCHAPSANTNDGLVRGLVPTPGQPLPPLYYAARSGNFVRADITFLRQDFSANLPLKAAAPWPEEQRFDFVTRLRPARPEEMAETTAKPGNYPQREAVLYALRGLTGKDGGDSSDKWRQLLGIAEKGKH